MKKRLTLLHMGDSITFGQYVDESLRWTTLVGHHLASKFSSSIELLSVNKGISGETTRLGLERYPRDVQGVGAHIQTLQFGMNDCNCWHTDNGLPRVSENAFRANIYEMIQRSRHSGIKRLILMTNPRSLRVAEMTSGESYDSANARYSQILRDVARAEQLPLCDIREKFDTFTENQLSELLLPAPDLLHLSPAGNRFYADLVIPFIEEALQALTTTSTLQVPT